MKIWNRIVAEWNALSPLDRRSIIFGLILFFIFIYLNLRIDQCVKK